MLIEILLIKLDTKRHEIRISPEKPTDSVYLENICWLQKLHPTIIQVHILICCTSIFSNLNDACILKSQRLVQ